MYTTTTMICRKHRQHKERFWFCQERYFGTPVSESNSFREVCTTG